MISTSEAELMVQTKENFDLKTLCFICNKTFAKPINLPPCDLPTLYSLSKSKHQQNKTEESKLKSTFSDNKMIIPCKCNEYAHPSCLDDYCLFNLSYTCSKCNTPFNVNYYISPIWNPIKVIGIIILLTLSHLILLAIGIAFIAFRFISHSQYDFWNNYFGVIIIVLTIISFTKVSLFFINLHKDKNKKISLVFAPYQPNSKQLITNEIVIDYLLKKRNMNYMSLMQVRMTDELYKEINIDDEQRLNFFIKENNIAMNTLNEKLRIDAMHNSKHPNLNEQLKISLILEESIHKIYPKIEGVLIKSIYDHNQDRNELRKEIPNLVREKKAVKASILKSKTKINELPRRKIMHQYSMSEIKRKCNLFSPLINSNCIGSDCNLMVNKVRDSKSNEINPFFYSITNDILLEIDDKEQLQEDKTKEENNNFEDETTPVFGINDYDIYSFIEKGKDNDKDDNII